MPQKIITPIALIWRLIVTGALVFGYNFLISLYGLAQAPFEGGMAVKQLEASDMTYAQSKFVLDGGMQGALFALVCFLIVVTWASLVFKIAKQNRDNETGSVNQ